MSYKYRQKKNHIKLQASNLYTGILMDSYRPREEKKMEMQLEWFYERESSGDPNLS